MSRALTGGLVALVLAGGGWAAWEYFGNREAGPGDPGPAVADQHAATGVRDGATPAPELAVVEPRPEPDPAPEAPPAGPAEAPAVEPSETPAVEPNASEVEAEAESDRAEPDPAPAARQAQEQDDPAPAEAGQDEPAFDVVRVDRNGDMIIAGRAAPGQTVDIMLGELVLATVVTDAGGAFATLLSSDLTTEAQELRLRVRSARATAPADEAPEPTARADGPQAPQGTEGPAESDPVTPAETPVAETETPTPEPPAVVAAVPEEVAPQEVAPAPAAPAATQAPAQEVPTPAAEEAETTGSAADDDAAPAPDPAEAPPQMPATTSATPPTDQAAAAPTDQSTAAVTSEPSGAQPETAQAPDGEGPGETAAEDPAPAEGEAEFVYSTPVIILPVAEGDEAPAIVQPTEDELALLQPSGGEARGVVLDRVTYGETGAVRFDGRARPGRAVRIYGNAAVLGTTQVAGDGAWTWSLPRARAEGIQLFRFDEVDRTGQVTSRIETPFQYTTVSAQVLRQRRVVIQRGDMLWRIAEQYYGEGIRYSLIYRANDDLIRDPDLIYPGQVFSIPELVDAE